jgi:uncharacterized SAM-binding protein YcdF (DUF218 family)
MLRRAFLCGRATLALLGIVLLVVTFTPIVKWAASGLQQDWYDGDSPVLIVLGGSMLVPGTGPTATLGQDSYLRCIYAAWEFHSHRYNYVLVTGSNGLAQSMARLLVSQSVPVAQILEETAATSTYENAQFSKRILQNRYGSNLPSVVVLTSDYHSWRALRTFQHAGFNAHVIAIPDVIKQSSRVAFRWAGFVTLCEEAAKIVYYRATGKL